MSIYRHYYEKYLKSWQRLVDSVEYSSDKKLPKRKPIGNVLL